MKFEGKENLNKTRNSKKLSQKLRPSYNPAE
jgi:hypothetical protein